MSGERLNMAENSQETIAPAESTTVPSQESGRPSVLERLKRFLGAIGKGASTAEEMGIYHPMEPPKPDQKSPPVPEPSKP